VPADAGTPRTSPAISLRTVTASPRSCLKAPLLTPGWRGGRMGGRGTEEAVEDRLRPEQSPVKDRWTTIPVAWTCQWRLFSMCQNSLRIGDRIVVIPCLGLLILIAAFAQGAYGETVKQVSSSQPNTDIVLPTRHYPGGNSERDVLTWASKIAPDDLLVTTLRDVARIRRGTPLWVQRLRVIPADTASYHYSNDPIASCAVSDGKVLSAYCDFKPGVHGGPTRVVLCATNAATGVLVAQRRAVLDQRIAREMVAMMPWRGGALILFRQAGGSNIGGSLWFACRDKAITVALKDPAGARGWHFLAKQDEVTGTSVLLSRSAAAGLASFRILRSADSSDRVVKLREPHDCPGATWLDATETIVLSSFAQDNRLRMIAYSVKTGEARWHVRVPDNLTVLDSHPLIVGDRIICAGIMEVPLWKTGLLSVSTRDGRITLETAFPPAGVRGKIYSSGRPFFTIDKEIVFAASALADDSAGEPYSVYRVKRPGDKPTLVTTITGADANVLPFHIQFFLQARNGYWLGLRTGMIAYRQWGSSAKPRRVMLLPTPPASGKDSMRPDG